MVDVTCTPACDPNIPIAIPGQVPEQLCPACPEPPVTVSALDCLGVVAPLVGAGLVQTVPHPTAVQRVLLCNPAEYDKTILCDAVTGSKVVVVTTYSATGVPTSLAYNLDGTAYVGTIASLVSCDVDIESDQVLGCAGGVSFVQWVIKRDGVATGVVYYTNATGAVVPAPVGFTVGACGGMHLLEIGCYTTPVVSQPTWFGPYTFSSNAGATFGAPPALPFTHATTASGTYRWRSTLTIPEGVINPVTINFSGDTHDPVAGAAGGRLFIDGVDIGSAGASVPVALSVTLSAGTHVFEWREPATATANGTDFLATIVGSYKRSVEAIKTLDATTGVPNALALYDGIVLIPRVVGDSYTPGACSFALPSAIATTRIPRAGVNTAIPTGLQSVSIMKTTGVGTVIVTMPNAETYTLTDRGETFNQSSDIVEGPLPAYAVAATGGSTWKWQGLT